MIRVNLYATFRPIVGAKSLELELPDDSSVQQILDHLFSLHPRLKPELVTEQGELQQYVSLFVLGRDIRYLEGLKTKLQRGQVLDIFPPVAGG